MLTLGIRSATLPFAGPSPALPQPPRVQLDTAYRVPTGPTITVRAGGDFQAALDVAQPGETVSLEAGASFRGNFTLPRKAGSGWIVVRSAALDRDLPSPGTRISPEFARVMPKLVTPNSVQVLQAAPGARGYRFIGIEFTTSPSVSTMRQIVAFGGAQARAEDTPSELILDRCYVHGHPTSNVFRGVLLNSASSAVIDSYVGEIHVAGHDSQAILGFNGPGPFKIENNFLEAAGENIMFGGGDPRIAGLVPSDIEIRGNHLFKPLRWRQGAPDFVGTRWTVKNLLELKNAQRVLIEGNLLENVWAESQGGAAVVLTPRNGGKAPWSVVQDVMFRNNVVLRAEGGFGGQSVDDHHPSQPMRRIAIINNLWLSIERSFFTMAVPTVPLEDFVVDHNTAIPTRQFAYDLDPGVAPALVRFQFTNNITGRGAYGVKFPNTDAAVARWTPAADVRRNAMIWQDHSPTSTGAPGRIEKGLGPGRYTVLSAVATGLRPDGTLEPTSPLKGASTGGKDVGVDFEMLGAWAQVATPASQRLR